MKTNLPTVPLTQLPTPLHALPRFSAWLDADVEVWIKRDDLTGLALGGNKLRKLSYLAADALRQGCTDLVTTGAAQSNHCRQTAAAAAHIGLPCHLVLRGEPNDRPGGNLILDRILDARLYWAGSADTTAAMESVVSGLKASGRHPYAIPLGGSTPVGAVGYAFAWCEMVEQARKIEIDFDAVMFASSSGGTQAGLSIGAGETGWSGTLHGISVDHDLASLDEITSDLTAMTAELLEVAQPHPVKVHDAYLGAGYGVLGEVERDAILAMARNEGILLDPVYTGRALAGLIDQVRKGHLRGRVLFWHTGGTPALFAYENELR